MLADLAKMPHVLIAGTTGSGKSVCINSLIVSMLYKASPDEDVKLPDDRPQGGGTDGMYNGMPHHAGARGHRPPQKASGALGWAVSEMMKPL